MKKAIVVFALILAAEAGYIAGSAELPRKAEAEKTIMICRKRAGKSDEAKTKKLYPVALASALRSRDFYEGIANHYCDLLTEAGIFSPVIK